MSYEILKSSQISISVLKIMGFFEAIGSLNASVSRTVKIITPWWPIWISVGLQDDAIANILGPLPLILLSIPCTTRANFIIFPVQLTRITPLLCSCGYREQFGVLVSASRNDIVEKVNAKNVWSWSRFSLLYSIWNPYANSYQRDDWVTNVKSYMGVESHHTICVWQFRYATAHNSFKI